MSINEKMKELELSLPPFNNPAANYSPAVRFGDMVVTAGQTPRLSGKMKYEGRVDDTNVDEGYEAAKLCTLNALGIIDALAGGLDNVQKIVKVTGFVNCGDDFIKQSTVIDGSTDLLCALFGDNGRPARAAVGVGSLPSKAMCEVELFVQLKDVTKALI